MQREGRLLLAPSLSPFAVPLPDVASRAEFAPPRAKLPWEGQVQTKGRHYYEAGR